jgi:hypothetical protein
MSSDAKKLEDIQQKFGVLFSNRCFLHFYYRYAYALQQLKWHT